MGGLQVRAGQPRLSPRELGAHDLARPRGSHAGPGPDQDDVVLEAGEEAAEPGRGQPAAIGVAVVKALGN
jgi:hypothetical protein